MQLFGVLFMIDSTVVVRHDDNCMHYIGSRFIISHDALLEHPGHRYIICEVGWRISIKPKMVDPFIETLILLGAYYRCAAASTV